MLPHSLEAEEFLLSCCLLDGADVITRARAAGLNPDAFYDTKHGTIFDCLTTLLQAGKPTDIATVAEELKTTRQLDQIGGYSFLAQVSRQIPTTAQASYFIEKVREQALLRELIRSAGRIVEDCHSFSGDIDKCLTTARARLDHLVERTRGSAMSRLAACQYDPAVQLPEIQPVFRIGPTPVCTRGNLSTITAQAKSGKSALLSAFLAATFADEEKAGDLLTVTGVNDKGFAVIHIDTELPRKKHEQLMHIVVARSGAQAMPAWLHSYARKGASPAELQEEVEAAIRAKHREFGGIHSVMLDGAADFVEDVNDPRECNRFVTRLEKLAVEFDTAIVAVLHLNPIANREAVVKARGHLGSQMQRKGETDIRLVKDDSGTTTVFTDPQGTRGEPIFEKNGPRFAWDCDEGMHLFVRTKQASRDEEKAVRLRELAMEIWGENQGLRYSEIIPRIRERCRIKDSGAEEKFSDMKKFGVIVKQIHKWHIAS